jgi:hypothetical protein
MVEERLKDLAARANGLWQAVRLLREVGGRGVSNATEAVKTQAARIVANLDPASKALSGMNEPGYLENVPRDAACAMERAARVAIDAASRVLAHSIVDEVVTECCQISAALAPGDWMGFVEQRKVALSDVLLTSPSDIARQMLTAYLEQLGHMPLPDRIDILIAKCHTEPAGGLDRDRFLQIQQRRKGILQALDVPETHTAEDLSFLEAACSHFISLVAAKHGLEMSPAKSIDESLLVSTSLLALTDGVKKLWTMGGQVFVTDADDNARQLPLTLPAARANISPDGRRRVFVKYRLRSSEEMNGEQRDYRRSRSVGNIWVADSDGSREELVLQGGPCPDLIMTDVAAHFPRELEGISSAQFDPDGRQVYFLASAWESSGAIYVLDLESRRVRFLTDGNAFVVLHGDPYRGHLLVNKHRYHGPPVFGAYDHYWRISASGEEAGDAGADLAGALASLYGDGQRAAVGT